MHGKSKRTFAIRFATWRIIRNPPASGFTACHYMNRIAASLRDSVKNGWYTCFRHTTRSSISFLLNPIEVDQAPIQDDLALVRSHLAEAKGKRHKCSVFYGKNRNLRPALLDCRPDTRNK